MQTVTAVKCVEQWTLMLLYGKNPQILEFFRKTVRINMWVPPHPLISKTKETAGWSTSAKDELCRVPGALTTLYTRYTAESSRSMWKQEFRLNFMLRAL